MGERPRIFVSYAHADTEWLKALDPHLKGLERHAQVERFDDRELVGGDDWGAKIKAALDSADIILLLVTANFTASDYIHRIELPTALKRRKAAGCAIVPVLFENCYRELLGIDDINYLPKDESGALKPFNKWRKAQKPDALTQIVKHIHAQLKRRGPDTGTEQPVRAGGSADPSPSGGDMRAPLSAAVPSGGEPPRLPADLGDFIGREKEIDALTATLRRASGPRIAAICGMGGAGKSTLATHAAHRVADEYPDGQVVVDMRGTRGEPKTAAAAMQEIAAGFDRAVQLPPEPDAATAAYRRLLGGKRVLLLLDDAADEAQVRPLLTLGPPAGFVVTSRRRLVLPGQHRVALDEMSAAEARDLLRGIVDPGRATDVELDSVAEQCRRLPLALRVAGTFLDKHANWRVARYVEALRQERTRLRIDGDKDLDVEAVLGFSAARLTASNRMLAERWQMLSVFPASFDRLAAAAVWGIADEDETLRDLGRLLEQSLLLYEAASERCRLHDLMRPVARNAFGYEAAQAEQSSDTAERLAAAAARHASHYYAVLAAADDLYLKGGDDVARGLALFDRERVQIEAGQTWAAERQSQDDNAARLALSYPDAGVYVLFLRLHPRHRVAWLETAIAAARRLGDRPGEGRALGNLGLAYAALGETRRAIEHYEQVLAIAREIGDRRSEGSVLGNLGLAYAALGETRRAIEHYEQRLAIARETGDRSGEGNALGNLGLAYAALGETRRAIEHYEHRLAIAREIRDRSGEASALGNLGNAYADLGEMRRAIEHHEQHLAIACKTGDRRGEGNALGNLGLAYAALGETRRAIEHYEQHLAIARETGDRGGEGRGLGNLGLAYADLGETRRAIEHHEQHLAIAREISDRRGEANSNFNMAFSLRKLGDAEAATNNMKAALGLFEAMELLEADKARWHLDEWGASG